MFQGKKEAGGVLSEAAYVHRVLLEALEHKAGMVSGHEVPRSGLI